MIIGCKIFIFMQGRTEGGGGVTPLTCFWNLLMFRPPLLLDFALKIVKIWPNLIARPPLRGSIRPSLYENDENFLIPLYSFLFLGIIHIFLIGHILTNFCSTHIHHFIYFLNNSMTYLLIFVVSKCTKVNCFVISMILLMAEGVEKWLSSLCLISENITIEKNRKHDFFHCKDQIKRKISDEHSSLLCSAKLNRKPSKTKFKVKKMSCFYRSIRWFWRFWSSDVFKNLIHSEAI